MSALYPYRYLNHIEFKDVMVPAQRYLFKFENHRKEIPHLKLHEKDFLFRTMKVLENDSGKRVYDLFKIPEAKEFVFDRIILTHANKEKVAFDGYVSGPYGALSPAEKRRNKRFFYEYLNAWKNQIQEGKGPYLSVVKIEIGTKIKKWTGSVGESQKNIHSIEKKIELIYASFFHIYYKAKLFFDEKPKPYVLRVVGGFDVVFNIYSFVHIMSRHYFPDMNKGIGASLNDGFEIDLDYLPDEVLPLIERSNSISPITRETEYLLYSIGADHYIIWLKYKVLNETKNEGFEVRSFYKCEDQRDLDKVGIPGQYIVSIPINQESSFHG